MLFRSDVQVVLGMHEMRHLRMYIAYNEGKIYITDANAGSQPRAAH